MAVRSRLAGSGAAATSHAVPLPADAATGDRVNVGFVNDDTNADASPSTGWTSLGTRDQGTGTNHSLSVFTRVLDGGADDSLTVNLVDDVSGSPVSQQAQWVAIAMVGNGGAPEPVVFNDGGNALAATVGAITGLATGDYDSVIFLGLDDNGNLGHPNVTAPTGWGNLTQDAATTHDVLAHSMDRSADGVTGFSPGNITWDDDDQWITAHIVMPQMAAVTDTFGKTTDDPDDSSASSTDKVAVSQATPDQSGNVQTGHARLWLTQTGSTGVKFLIYSDSAGEPDALLAESDEITLTDTVEAEQVFTFSGANQIQVVSGTPYWIGFFWQDPGADPQSVNFSRDSTADLRREQSGVTVTWSTAPDPFGTGDSFSGPVDAFITYEVTSGAITGTAAADLGFTATAAGVVTPGGQVTGTASAALGFTAAATGTVTQRVIATADFGFAATATGRRLRFGIATADFGFIARAESAEIVTGTASADFGFTAVADGFTIDDPGVPFLTNALGDEAFLAVEIAWGADLGADFITWTWTDITTDVRQEPGISTSLGRADEASVSQPAQATMELDNQTAAYSLGGHSPNWPNVRRNTPVRVRIRTERESGFETVFIGFADGFTPGWDSLTGNIPVVTLSASGALRRMQQGDAPVISAFRRAMTATPTVLAYWPFEEGRNATRAPAVRGGSDMVSAGGAHEFDSASPFDCSAPLVTLRSSPEGVFESFDATVDDYTDTGETQVRWLMSVPRNGLPHGAFLADIFTSGSAARWAVTYSALPAQGGLNMTIFNSGGGVIEETFDIGFAINGHDLRFSLELEQNGSEVDWRIGTVAPSDLGAGFFEGGITGHDVGVVTSVSMGGNDVDNVVLGHVTVQNVVTSLFEASGPLQAHRGEFPTAGGPTGAGRIGRLGEENDVKIGVFGTGEPVSSNDTLGPQLVKPLLDLLHETETADQGQLWDGLVQPGLLYSTRRRREQGIVNLTIDAAAGELAEPWQPADDDQRNRNRVEGRITTGITSVFEDTTGPLGTAAVGIYDTTIEANNEHDEMAIQYAAWLVHLGTTGGYRYPSVTVNLRAAPQLAANVLGVVPGERINIVNLGDTFAAFPAGTGTVSLVVEGISHDISPVQWLTTFRCSPYSPWGVAVVAGEAGDQGELVWRLDTDGSILLGDHDVEATSITVASDPQPIANDTFTRTVSNGWGDADLGGPYSLAGTSGSLTSDFNVADGVGTIAINGTDRSEFTFLESLSVQDVDITATCSLSFSDVTGSSVEICNVMVRGTSFVDRIQAHVQVTTAQNVGIGIIEVIDNDHIEIAPSIIVSDLSFTGTLQVRMQAQGRAIRARVWDPAGAEPDAWHAEATVDAAISGWVGVRAAVTEGNTNTLPIVFSHDDLVATTTEPPGGPLWTTVPDDYPITLDVGGIPVVATAGSGASSPQTFTVEPLPLPRTDGLPVKLWDPRPIGL